MRYKRNELIDMLRETKKRNGYIIAAGAGSGLSAKSIEKGGADLLMVFNSGYYRMQGHGSLSGWMPLGNANDVAMELGKKWVLPITKKVPVICSVFAQDVTRVISDYLDDVIDAGFSGVNNFPTMGMIDGNFREQLEITGFSYDKEVEMVRLCKDKDIFTIVYVFNEKESEQMAKAGADVIVSHVGLTVGGAVGTKKAVTIEESAAITKRIIESGKKYQPEALWLVHGGPLATPSDFKKFLEYLPDIDGFVGASSMERIPTERSISATVEEFKRI